MSYEEYKDLNAKSQSSIPHDFENLPPLRRGMSLNFGIEWERLWQRTGNHSRLFLSRLKPYVSVYIFPLLREVFLLCFVIRFTLRASL